MQKLIRILLMVAGLAFVQLVQANTIEMAPGNCFAETPDQPLPPIPPPPPPEKA